MNDTNKPISIFLSYARGDDDDNYDDANLNFMRRLYNHLTNEGFVVWWDRESLPSRSTPFPKELEDAIRAHERFVLVIGPNAVESQWVQSELRFAIEQCKPITPILRVGEHKDIPKPVAQINTIDVREARESAGLVDLVNRLKQPAPLGKLFGFKTSKEVYIQREVPYNAARDVLCKDAILPKDNSNPLSSVLALHGMGGIGKSTIATALANDCQIRRHYKDGIIWVEVNQNHNIISLFETIGTFFGDDRANYQDVNSASIHLSRILQDKHTLIIFDDVWDEKIIRDFPIMGTNCRLLITTRSRTLAERVSDEAIQLNVLSDEEGAKLIAELLEDTSDVGSYKQINRRLGGHTLAVKLAALQIKNQYADDALDLLRLLEKQSRGKNPFRDLEIEETDKDQNLALSLSLSYDALKDDDLQRRFRATGVIALDSIFDRTMLARLWGDEDEDGARKPLNKLIVLGLLEIDDHGNVSQHRLLNVYARGLLLETDELDMVFDRYVEYVTHSTYLFDIVRHDVWWLLDRFLPHIIFVGDNLVRQFEQNQADESFLSLVVDFAKGTIHYLRLRLKISDVIDIKLPQGIQWLSLGLRAAKLSKDQQSEATLANSLGGLYDGLGDKWTSLKYFEQALLIYDALGDVHGKGAALGNIGRAYFALGKKEIALENLKTALSIIQSLEDVSSEATILCNLGLVWNSMNNFDEALACFNQALVVFNEVDDIRGRAVTLNNIGLIKSNEKKISEALEIFELSLNLSRSIGDRREEGNTLRNIGDCYLVSDDYDKSMEIYQSAIQIFDEINAGAELATSYLSFSYLQEKLGNHEQAFNMIKTGYQKLIELNLPQDSIGIPIDTYERFMQQLAVKLYIQNTIAVMTKFPEELESWREEILDFVSLSESVDNVTLIEFSTALLAILNGDSPILPEENPYSDAIRQIIKIIANNS